MLFGPTFRVELVTVARRRRYFFLRVLYGSIALFVLWSTYTTSHLYAYDTDISNSIQAGQKLATAFFVAFSLMQMWAILIVGPAMAAGTIAIERERRTIEYLFATDLSNAEIVLGKTIARLCLLGQFLLVCLPILFIFRMLGGISAQLLLSTFLLAGSTAIMVTALGVCVSVWSPKSRDATVRAYAALFVLLVVPSIVQRLGSQFGGGLWQQYGEPAILYCQMVNPLGPLFASMVGGKFDLTAILPTVFAQLAVAGVLLLFSVAAVRRVHLRETTRSANAKSKRQYQLLPRRRRPVGERPMVWKEVFSQSASTRLGAVGMIAVGLVLGLFLIGSCAAFADALWWQPTNGPENYHGFILGYSALIGSGMLLLLGVNASGLITSEKERDCWLSLIATPLSGQEILQGKTLGNLYSMRWPFLALAFAWALGVVLDPALLWSALALLVTLLLTGWYVTNLGLYFSLRSPTTMRSMGITLATLCFFGGGYLMCCCPIATAGGGNDSILVFLAPCIPFLLMFASALSGSRDLHFWQEAAVPTAFVLGLLCYLIAGVVFYVIARSDFDAYAGRGGRTPEGPSQ